MNNLLNQGIEYFNNLIAKRQAQKRAKLRQQFTVSVVAEVAITEDPTNPLLQIQAKVKLSDVTHDCLFETVLFDNIEPGHNLIVISTDRYIIVLRQIVGTVLDRQLSDMVVRVARSQLAVKLVTKKCSMLTAGPVVSTIESIGQKDITFGGTSPMSLNIRRLSPYN